jgi:hypothetical protein
MPAKNHVGVEIFYGDTGVNGRKFDTTQGGTQIISFNAREKKSKIFFFKDECYTKYVANDNYFEPIIFKRSGV